MTGETEAKSRASDGTLDFSFVPAHPQGVIRPRMVIQPKLTIHTEGDAYEQEADLIADRVMRMPARRAEPAHVQMKAESPGGAGFGVVPPIVHEVLQGSGQPLDEDTRAFADPRFGQDFSRVRVHTDTKAADSARAIHAQAYTAGNDVVFGPGQFAPHTGAGRKLLVHELAHVVQQGGFSNPAHVQRQPAPTKKKDEETKKRDSVRLHNEQQKHVADLLAKARSTKTSAALDPLAAGNIYRNVIGLLDSGRLTLRILTPTHYSNTANSAYFDSRVAYPTVGGDYIIPDGKTQGGGPGIDRPIPGESGATQKVLPQPVLQPMPPKVETPPGGSAPAQGEQPAPATPAASNPAPPQVQWSTADVRVYLSTVPVTEDELRGTLVHEGEHVADWSHLRAASLKDPAAMLEEYKTEFRAHWVQPGVTIFSDDPIRASQKDVVIPPDRNCVACPAPPAGGPMQPIRTAQTHLKNKKQEEIFWILLSVYKDQQFDCFYVCDQNFRKEADNYDHPAGENVIASARITDLEISLRKLKPDMTRDQVIKTDLLTMAENLDDLDWAFLQNNLSGPFWSLLGSFAPAPIAAELHTLARKGRPKTSEVDEAWRRALKKLK